MITLNLKIQKQDMEKVVKINTIEAFNVGNLVALKPSSIYQSVSAPVE